MKKIVLCFSLVILGLLFSNFSAKARIVFDKPDDWYQFYTQEATEYMEENFSTLAEVELTYTHAKKAVERTIYFYGSSNEDDDSDAFMETYWSALMTMNFGDSFARALGQKNDASSSALSKEMDMNNDSIGIDLYWVWNDNYKYMGSSNDEDDLAFFIAQAVKGGRHYGIKKISGSSLVSSNTGYKLPAYAEHTDDYTYYDDFLHTHSCDFCGEIGKEDHVAKVTFSTELELYGVPGQKYCSLCRHYFGF